MMEWLTSWWTGRSLAKRARTRIADLEPCALAKIVGRAHAVGEPILAPFTGTPSATMRVAGERVERQDRRFVTVELDDVDFGHAFYVEDESGVALVERRGWSTLIVERRIVTGADRVRAEAHLDRFFARYGQEHRTFFDGFGQLVRYSEWVIPEGAQVAVLGAVEPAAKPIERGEAPGVMARGYREHLRPMALVPPEHGRLLVSVRPEHAAR